MRFWTDQLFAGSYVAETVDYTYSVYSSDKLEHSWTQLSPESNESNVINKQITNNTITF